MFQINALPKILPLILLGSSLGLSGCLSFLPDPEPAPTLYRLGSNFTPAAPSTAAELVRVDRPAASQVFSTSNIVVSDGGQKLSVVANANWAESMPAMIQSTLIDALEGSPKFVGLTSSSGANTTTRLNLSIQHFEAIFDNGKKNAPLATVSYRVTYSDISNRKLLGTYTAKQTRRADSINVSSVVSAIESANQSAMLDIVRWMETRQSQGGS